MNNLGWDAVDFRQFMVAMEMRIDRHQPVEMARQDRSKGSRRHRLAGMEAYVLAHVSEVRGDEPDPASAKIARGVGCEQQRQQLGVRMIETGQQDDLAVADVVSDPEIGFPVRKLTMLDRADLCIERGG